MTAPRIAAEARRTRAAGEPCEPVLMPDDFLANITEPAEKMRAWTKLVLLRLRENYRYRELYFDALLRGRVPPRA